MKKIILCASLLVTVVLADSGKLIDIVSENIIKVEQNGKMKRIHLSGIELFAKANNNTNEVNYEKRDALQKKTIAYMKKTLEGDDIIKYSVLDRDDNGVEKVWIQDHELNYKMVRDGYAVVNTEDPSLLHALEMRMTMAMKYAKDKKLGLWADESNGMTLLVNQERHMCGWSTSKTHTGISKEEIIEELYARLNIKENKYQLYVHADIK